MNWFIETQPAHLQKNSNKTLNLKNATNCRLKSSRAFETLSQT